MASDSRQPGRPRDESAGKAILEATRALVLAEGYDAVAITRILAVAGVSRQTLYRRWPTKADLVLEAFSQSPVPPIEIRDGAPVRAALLAFLERLLAHLARDAEAIRSLIGAAAGDAVFDAGFQAKFVAPREAGLRAGLAEAVARGELPAGTDVGLAAEVIHGVLWYRLLNRRPFEPGLAAALVAQAFAAA